MAKPQIKLFANSAIKFKGEIVFGKELTVENEQQARALIDCGAASDVDGYFDKAVVENTGNSSPDKTLMPVERITLIRDAIAKLNPNFDYRKHWHADGKPNIKVLTDMTESIITEEERDYVWALINS